MRTAMEQNRLVALREMNEDAADDADVSPPIPINLRTLLQTRIHSLSPALKKVLQYMSVLGRPGAPALLATLTQQPNVDLLLQQLARKGLLNYVIETDRWQISHWLTETIVYDGLLKIQQQILHREIAETLETMWQSTETIYADELAYHFEQANEPQKAVVYHIEAAEFAAALAAHEEAIAHFTSAASLLANTLGIEDALRWKVASGLGASYLAQGRYAEAITTIEQALPLEAPSAECRALALRRLGQVYQKQGKPEDAIKVFDQAFALLTKHHTPSANLEQARLYISRAWTFFFSGAHEQAKADCVHGLEVAAKISNLREQSAAHSLLGAIYHKQGNLESAIEHTKTAMEIRKQTNFDWGVASMLSSLGRLSIAAGQFKQAQQYFMESLYLRRDMGDAEGVSTCHIHLGKLAADTGNLNNSEFHYRAGLKIAEHMNASYLSTSANIGLARVALLRNRLAEAEELLNVSVHEAESMQMKDLLLDAHLLQAEILLALKQHAQAELLAGQTALAAQADRVPVLEAAAWRITCEAQIAQGSENAEATLDKGMKALRTMTDPLEQVRWSLLSGKLHYLHGRRREAQDQLTAAKNALKKLDVNFESLLANAIPHKIT
ncbi:MAG: tetratricopeptide repeat protein [Caldilineaceae bacterium]